MRAFVMSCRGLIQSASAALQNLFPQPKVSLILVHGTMPDQVEGCFRQVEGQFQHAQLVLVNGVFRQPGRYGGNGIGLHYQRGNGNQLLSLGQYPAFAPQVGHGSLNQLLFTAFQRQHNVLLGKVLLGGDAFLVAWVFLARDDHPVFLTEQAGFQPVIVGGLHIKAKVDVALFQ